MPQSYCLKEGLTRLFRLSAGKARLATAEVLAIALMGGVAWLALRTGVKLLLFPELAALSHDVLTRPGGKWASQPIRMILTPLFTGSIGLLVSRYFPYGAIPVLAISILSLAIIRVLRSAIGPAISAGLLPLVVGERSSLYPIAIGAGLVVLAGVLWLWKRFETVEAEANEPAASIDDTLESTPQDRWWLLQLLALVLLLGLAAQFTGLRLLLFPPLVVMAYELFGHPELPGWIKRPSFFPLVCFLAAATGLICLRTLGETAVSAMLTVAVSIVLLRIFQMHMPPALAVGLLPFVIPSPDYWYPISVGIGTLVLCLWFAAKNRLRSPRVIA